MRTNDLLRFKNAGKLVIPEKLFFAARTVHGDYPVQQKSIGMSRQNSKAMAVLGEDNVLAFTNNGLDGLWIPYLPKGTSWDVLTGGQRWLASGPYSGCYFEIGLIEGSIYGAHISCEGKDDASYEAFDKNPRMKGREILFSQRIRMTELIPEGCSSVEAIIFANFAGGIPQVTRVDIKTSNVGGLSGEIFSVTNLM